MRIPSDYAGHYAGYINSNEHTNVQDPGRNQNAGEGSSRLYNIAIDNEGQEIDLNRRYNYDEDIDEYQENDLNKSYQYDEDIDRNQSQVQNTGIPSHIWNFFPNKD